MNAFPVVKLFFLLFAKNDPVSIDDLCIFHFRRQVYRRLSEVLGLSDESMVLSMFIGKM